MRFLATIALLFILLIPAGFADQATDDALFDQVRIKLANDREVGGGKIEVHVTDGKVELTGRVKTEKIKQKAEKIAKSVKGIKSVDNRLTVGPL